MSTQHSFVPPYFAYTIVLLLLYALQLQLQAKQNKLFFMRKDHAKRAFMCV